MNAQEKIKRLVISGVALIALSLFTILFVKNTLVALIIVLIAVLSLFIYVMAFGDHSD